MKVSEVIEILQKLFEEHGDVEVYKIKHHDYLASIFKSSIIYNEKEKKIEI